MVGVPLPLYEADHCGDKVWLTERRGHLQQPKSKTY